MNKVIIIAILLTLAYGQFSIELTPTKISDTTGNVIDTVYTNQVLYSNEESQVPTIFDTTSESNWRISANSIAGTTPPTVQVDARQVKLVNTNTNSVPVTVNEKKIDTVSVNSGSLPSATSTPAQTLTADQTAWTKTVINGLGVEGKNSFLTTLNAKLNQAINGFSFYIHSCTNQIVFGAPEGYFAKNKPVTCEKNTVLDTNLAGVWALHLTSIQIGGGTYGSTQSAIPFTSGTETTGQKYQDMYFDSNTEYIWVDTATLSFITSQLSGSGINCDTSGTHIICPCEPSSKPDIKFQFYCKNTANTFSLKFKDYTKKVGTTCQLLFKALPVVTPAPAHPAAFRFGYAWFKGVYTFFELATGKETISMSDSYDVGCQAKTLDPTYRTFFIVAGLLLILFAIAILISSMQKVPYNPNLAPVKKQQQPQQQQPPQRVMYSMPPQQSYIVQQQPVQYVQAPISQTMLVSQSPTRIMQGGQSPIYRQAF